MKRFWKIFFSTLDSDSCPGFCRCHQHRCQSPIFSVTNPFLTRATFETDQSVHRYQNLENETINIFFAVCIGVNITFAVGFVVTFAEIRALKLHLWRLNHHTNPALVTLLKSCCHQHRNSVAKINKLSSTLLTNTINLFWIWLLGNMINIISHITSPIQIFEMPSKLGGNLTTDILWLKSVCFSL